MKTTKQFTLLLLYALLSVAATFAQTANPMPQDVTIIIQQEQVRFTSQKPIQMMQLNIFNQAGEKVYNSGPMTVAEITWPLQNGNGEALKSGLYAYTLSIQESGAAEARVRKGHFIVDRAQDRDTKTDKLWVTSQKESGIGTELTVARNESGTVAGTSTTSDHASERTSTSERDTTQREVAGRSEKTDSTKTAKATTEGAYDIGSRMEAVYPYTQLRFGASTADNGGYLISTLPSQAIIAGGSSWNGTNWIAKDRTASLTAHQNGMIQFFTNGNLGVGSPFGPVERMSIDVNGNVGIGTHTPSYTLDVGGPLRAVRGISSDVVVETTGGTNAWAKMWMITPSQKWNIGTSQNYKGNQFFLHDATTDQVRLSVQPGGGDIAFPIGNVGIGTTNPQTRLHVMSSTTGTSAIYGENTAGPGVYGKSTSNHGVFGESNSPANAGVYARNLSGGRALYAEGDTGQSRDKGGLVKAMIFVNQDGTIARCFNGITGATTGNCGIDVTNQYVGSYLVDFHSQINDRFFSLTTTGSYGTTDGNTINTRANFYFNARGITSNTQVVIKTFIAGEEQDNVSAASFVLIVY